MFASSTPHFKAAESRSSCSGGTLVMLVCARCMQLHSPRMPCFLFSFGEVRPVQREHATARYGPGAKFITVVVASTNALSPPKTLGHIAASKTRTCRPFVYSLLSCASLYVTHAIPTTTATTITKPTTINKNNILYNRKSRTWR